MVGRVNSTLRSIQAASPHRKTRTRSCTFPDSPLFDLDPFQPRFISFFTPSLAQDAKKKKSKNKNGALQPLIRPSSSSVSNLTLVFGRASSSSSSSSSTSPSSKQPHKQSINAREASAKVGDQRTQSSPSTSSSSNQHLPGTDYLTSLCDQAIHYSRDDTFSDNLQIVRSRLRDAATIFGQLLRTDRNQGAGKGKGRDLSYEITLVRSAYLQVVRTTRALLGREVDVIEAQIIRDYLEWELRLIKRGESELGLEGPVQRISTADSRGHVSLLTAVEMVQTSLLIRDVMLYLTSRSEESYLKRGRKGRRREREFRDEESAKAAIELWKSVKRIPGYIWTLSMPHSMAKGEDVGTPKDLIDHAQVMLTRALLTRGSLEEGLKSLENAVHRVGVDSSLTRLIADSISQHFVTTRRVILAKTSHNYRGTQRQTTPLAPYVTFLRTFATKLDAKGDKMREALWPHLDLFLQCIAGLETMRDRVRMGTVAALGAGETLTQTNRHRIMNECREATCLLKAWVSRWLQRAPENRPELSESTCNALLEMMLRPEKSPASSPRMALDLLRIMHARSDSSLPPSTVNVLLGGAQKLGDVNLTRRIVEAAVLDEAWKEPAKETDALEEEEGDVGLDRQTEPSVGSKEGIEAGDDWQKTKTRQTHLSSMMLHLLGIALRENKAHRLVSLIQTMSSSHLFSRKRLQAVFPDLSSSQLPIVAPRSVVFLLYPSLDITRKAKAYRSRNAIRRAPAAFHPATLTSVLKLCVKAGKTGLGERVWRLFKRASVRSMGKANQGKGWKVPLEAYTLMFQLYYEQARRQRADRKRDSKAAMVEGKEMVMRRLAAHRHRISEPLAKPTLCSRPVRTSSPHVRGWFHVRNTGSWRQFMASDMVMYRQQAAILASQKLYEEVRATWFETEGSSSEGPDALFFQTVVKLLFVAHIWHEDRNHLVAMVKDDMVRFGYLGNNKGVEE